MGLKKMLSKLLTDSLALSDDWADLECYREENKITGLPSEGEERVVFMGDSITRQWKEKQADFFTGHGYLCRGIGGQVTTQMLLRFQQDVIDLKPKIVVILAGTNDIANNQTIQVVMDNLKSMAEIADENGIRVILCSVLPTREYPWRTGVQQPEDKIIKLNKLIHDYCINKRFGYVDYFSSMVDDNNAMIEAYTTDGVHVTEAGYQVMEALVQQVIQGTV